MRETAMKNAILILALVAAICYADTHIPAGPVNGVWPATGSPYMIDGDINVPTDDSLIIAPGCSLIFTGHYSLTVDSMALFKAIGTVDDSIVFTAQDTVEIDTITWEGTGGYHGIKIAFSSIEVNLQYCTFEYGRAITMESGAAVYNEGEHVILSNCLFRFNYTPWGDGAGLYSETSIDLINCVFYRNNAGGFGNAIASYGDTNRIINCLIFDNGNDIDFPIMTIRLGGGAGIDYVINSTIIDNSTGLRFDKNCRIINSIIFNNSDINIQGSFDVENIVEFSCVDTLTSCTYLIYGSGIIFDSPYLDINYRIEPSSPCLDSGIDSVTLPWVTIYAPDHDIEGNPRPLGAGYDIGAYEYVPTGIEENSPSAKPAAFALSAHPNPFNSAITISFDFGSESRSVEQVGSATAAAPEGAEVEVFDIQGRIVGELQGGETIWKPEPSIGSGIYLVRAKYENQEVLKRIVYLK